MDNKTFRDRELLSAAQAIGGTTRLRAYFKLSGPGWLQSAITLGGGSLGGALYLGMLGGTSMLWLQLVAIVIGVIMLSAISYVTLSTGERPYAAINHYVNPVLGIGWITATVLANMIWIMPQFSLCCVALGKNLLAEGLSDRGDIIASAIIGVAAFAIVMMSFRPGWMSRFFDIMLKLMVGMIVLCFVAVVYRLAAEGSLDLNEILVGFIPKFSHWTTPAPDIQKILENMPAEQVSYWRDQITSNQQSSMIGVTATAVGLNMTFLLPYSMLARGWDKPFRGLARFDLITGMAIPYIVVTSCIVIASAHAFHAKADKQFLSDDPAVMQTSVLFDSTLKVLEARYANEHGVEAAADLADLDDVPKKQKLAEFAAGLSDAEKRLAPTLVKPNAGQLAASLSPLLGQKNANLVFGLGALGMGFSSIIILMLINGYAFAEIIGKYDSSAARTIGALAAGIMGFCWFIFWTGESKTWLIIVASTFAAILLPIAYVSFFALMNSRRLLGAEKPTGGRMVVWNILMGIGCLGALAQAWGGTILQMSKPGTGSFVVGGVATFLLLAVVGFSARLRESDTPPSS
jgi:Mn2+/Fe2+ NRAMP family transporter